MEDLVGVLGADGLEVRVGLSAQHQVQSGGDIPELGSFVAWWAQGRWTEVNDGAMHSETNTGNGEGANKQGPLNEMHCAGL